jgi:hypothetical protein
MALIIIASSLLLLVVLAWRKKRSNGTDKFILLSGSTLALMGAISFILSVSGLVDGMHGGPINAVLTALVGLVLAAAGYTLARNALDSLRLRKSGN